MFSSLFQGKVLNRFTRDLGFIDGMLARELAQVISASKFTLLYYVKNIKRHVKLKTI